MSYNQIQYQEPQIMQQANIYFQQPLNMQENLNYASSPNSFDNILQNFLTNRTNIRPNGKQLTKNRQQMKLSKIKKDLAYCSDLLAKIKTSENELQKNVNTMADDDWTDALANLNVKKEILNNLLKNYEQPNTQKIIQQTINKRLKKRLRNKKLKKQVNSAWQAARERRKVLHAKIDEWQTEMLAKDLANKQTLQHTERVPQILIGVTKKQTEAKQTITLLDSLIELRRVRRIQSNGNEIGENYFNQQIEQLKTIWRDALHNYEFEENELKSCLVSNRKTTETKWQKLLFGEEIREVDLLIKANDDFNKFINIRKTWDAFCCSNDHPFGTSIPLGWVMPNANSSPEWAAYRQT